ncbi:PH domain-containing protein [Haloprofundus marisrubri]|uniref:PH domain-containing protein n=1 Tax=Haloprofundus marisrubri TaxID=1514971 RepID=UPI0008F82688|nr:PH domain-containing protein [Haloprofundus marisrubri]
MSRGLPALWSALFGLPFVAVGGYIYGFQTQYPLVDGQSTAPPIAGVVLAVFGLFVCGIGLYVQFVGAPPAPSMRPRERFVDDRDPAQRNALAQAFAAIPFLASGISLLYFTEYPLVYPTLVFGVGLYLFSTGIHRYWRNTLTTYLVTNQRVMEEYRFLSLVRNELPMEKVRAVEERQSMRESLAGIGSVHVRAGASGGLTVTIDEVYDSTEFADDIRAQLGDEPDERDEYVTAVDDRRELNPSDADATRESLPADTSGDVDQSNDEFQFENDVEEARRDGHTAVERERRESSNRTSENDRTEQSQRR